MLVWDAVACCMAVSWCVFALCIITVSYLPKVSPTRLIHRHRVPDVAFCGDDAVGDHGAWSESYVPNVDHCMDEKLGRHLVWLRYLGERLLDVHARGHLLEIRHRLVTG